MIADEVLNGKTLDTNSNYLARRCFSIGLSLDFICVIPDRMEIIKGTVKDLSCKYDLVVTSGGIGPTHDDLTYQSLAEAFSDKRACQGKDNLMRLHQPTVEAMKNYYGVNELNDGQLRMATLPICLDEITYTPNIWVPLVRLGGNVLVLPGVPILFQQMLDHWLEKGPGNMGLKLEPRMRRMVKTLLKESQLAEELALFQKKVQQSGIAVGSYPKMLATGETFVVISLIGTVGQESLLDELCAELEETFQGRRITNY